jgi:hypothetical protein
LTASANIHATRTVIQLAYGKQQRFRLHHGDINLIGRTDARLPQHHSNYRLNNGDSVHFYIEPEESPADPPRFPYGMRTPGCHRLRRQPGWFNLEIPIESPRLQPGWNSVDIEVAGSDGGLHQLGSRFFWSPEPPALPLDLTDLGRFNSIQDIGQAVNGLFVLDRAGNAIRSANPVGADMLLLLGPPGLSQEATYCVRFGPQRGIWLCLSDFFAGHVPQDPGLGIKPGYCTNGLATMDRHGSCQAWIAWGDNLMDNDNAWGVHTRPGLARVPVQTGLKYRVRHQVVLRESLNICRFRVWPAGSPEPERWLCAVNTARVPPQLPRNPAASFGLFQYFGSPAEWSDIRIRSLDAAEIAAAAPGNSDHEN